MRLHELLDTLSEIFLTTDGVGAEHLSEGMWIKGRFERNIRIDRDTHSGGKSQTHAHVLGRKGEELGVVNLDGTASHGTLMKLSPEDATALTARGFQIRPDRVVEWISLGSDHEWILLG